MRTARTLLDIVRGALIGGAEVIPGVSGGTVALIVGVYDDLIHSAGALVRGLVRLVVDPLRGRGTGGALALLREVRWSVVLPVIAGMLAAIVVGASLLAPLIDEHPIETRALFTGLIVASLAVPARMVGRWGVREFVLAALAAVLTFFLTGIPAADPADPGPLVVAVSAAVAVCALVVPGVSGSFILLTVGMYAPTLAAVNDRDLGYLGVFVLGAVVGLGAFVSLLQWLLEHRRRVTLAIMTGLMVGSLRALWPWQDERGMLEPPGAQFLPALLLFAAGVVVVLAMLLVERRAVARRDS